MKTTLYRFALRHPQGAKHALTSFSFGLWALVALGVSWLIQQSLSTPDFFLSPPMAFVLAGLWMLSLASLVLKTAVLVRAERRAQA